METFHSLLLLLSVTAWSSVKTWTSSSSSVEVCRASDRAEVEQEEASGGGDGGGGGDGEVKEVEEGGNVVVVVVAK